MTSFGLPFRPRISKKVRELRLAEERRRAKKLDKSAPQDQRELEFDGDDSASRRGTEGRQLLRSYGK